MKNKILTTLVFILFALFQKEAVARSFELNQCRIKDKKTYNPLVNVGHYSEMSVKSALHAMRVGTRSAVDKFIKRSEAPLVETIENTLDSVECKETHMICKSEQMVEVYYQTKKQKFKDIAKAFRRDRLSIWNSLMSKYNSGFSIMGRSTYQRDIDYITRRFESLYERTLSDLKRVNMTYPEIYCLRVK